MTRPSLLALLALLLLAAPAEAQRITGYDPGRPAAATTGAPARAHAAAVAEPDAAAGAGAGVDDPLAANGLGGALCRNQSLSAALSARAREDCALAGSVAARAPIGHYGFDVHVDTGALGVSSSALLSAVQTLVLTPLWTALLWLTNALLSTLEWAFALDPLDGGTMAGVARGLADVRRTVTEPWLALVLCLAAVALLHHALIRRRVTESLAGALVMAAMMLAGLWIISDPAGTVGELNRTANQAGLGTVAAVSTGNPARGPAALGDGLRSVFASAVEGPWCYLEFGDVSWCRDPARRDPRLAQAAQKLRTQLARDTRCPDRDCPPQARAARAQADLLARARTNGELFLALPANQGTRNAITDEHSLFRVLCANDDDNHCRGATARQATWRTEAGTWPRAGGLLLITAGVAGMLALLGFLALRLIGAAILTLVFLLLAPVAVLAPALGAGGRESFRAWGERLLGALVSKVIYAVLLGVVLVVLRILESLGSLGWWTQWLLVAAFWWIVFLHRHQVIAYAHLGQPDHGARGLRVAGSVLAGRQLVQMAGGAMRPPRRAAVATVTGSASVVRRGREGARNVRAERRMAAAETAHERAIAARVGQADQTLAREHRGALAVHEDTGRQDAELRVLETRRQRIDQAAREAHGSGDERRATRLAVRGADVQRQIDERRDQQRRARELVERSTRAREDTGTPFTATQRQERGTLLDAQSNLRRGVTPGPRADPARYRDYARLAGLADLTPQEYSRQGAAEQRRTRAAIDRALKDRPSAGEPAEEERPRWRRAPREVSRESQRDRRLRQFPIEDRDD